MSETVLVVDDNEHAVHIAEIVLRSAGYEVKTAFNGLGALASVAQQRPDCILLDIMMPGMSGLDVLGRLKEDALTAPIPVILVTAKSQSEDLLVGYKEGADYYITKPYSRQELLYGVRLVLGNTPSATSPGPRVE